MVIVVGFQPQPIGAKTPDMLLLEAAHFMLLPLQGVDCIKLSFKWGCEILLTKDER